MDGRGHAGMAMTDVDGGITYRNTTVLEMAHTNSGGGITNVKITVLRHVVRAPHAVVWAER